MLYKATRGPGSKTGCKLNSGSSAGMNCHDSLEASAKSQRPSVETELIVRQAGSRGA